MNDSANQATHLGQQDDQPLQSSGYTASSMENPYQDLPPEYQQESDEIVQVVYQSDPNGSLVGVDASLLDGSMLYGNQNLAYDQPEVWPGLGAEGAMSSSSSLGLQQLSRAASTLPSVAEESSSGGGTVGTGTCGALSHTEDGYADQNISPNLADKQMDLSSDMHSSPQNDAGEFIEGSYPLAFDHSQSLAQKQEPFISTNQRPPEYAQVGEPKTDSPQFNPQAIYSTIRRKHGRAKGKSLENAHGPLIKSETVFEKPENLNAEYMADVSSESSTLPMKQKALAIEEISEDDELHQEDASNVADGCLIEEQENNSETVIDTEMGQLVARPKQGVAESGSFRNNFRRKLVGSSSASNENDLIAHRQKLIELQEANLSANDGAKSNENDEEASYRSGSFKRNHSVSFNVSRGSRHSVDIRNLPSYLMVKRASIVDVAKGAMSSLMQSFGGGSSNTTSRRDSSPDEEPIFEEPIAPTLSLGQRVAMVRNNGTEFGTVGWIGQLPEVDYDWVVGVIFDNMIGNCDGEHNGVRYFYAHENYAMFVPLSALTKTDNYIGRPETGTMLSRMSISLKPGQLISIQRSSIRLQHCFLNAPHQRVGHDVRAVSNRLHCQCHNCGPCAHLTKQGHHRFSGLPPPHFVGHHVPKKKDSLAHAAVELLAHHHHHFHEEEHHQEEEYQFGDNAAHACNFVRYSCCQQHGIAGHDFSADCRMVRPELLDNFIHAPRAPHRRSRSRRPRPTRANRPAQTKEEIIANEFNQLASANDQKNMLLDGDNPSSYYESNNSQNSEPESSSGSSSRSASLSDDQQVDSRQQQTLQQYPDQVNYNTRASYQSTTLSSHFQGLSLYNTMDSTMSIMDQRRFISRPESQIYSTSTQSDDYYSYSERSSFGASLRRCINCILGREKRKRQTKRKISARNKFIEYRRKQSTFVPSTLAKPQDDLLAASHGMMFYNNQLIDEAEEDVDESSRSDS